MAVQDDRREIEQIELFELSLPNDKSRAGTDALLLLDSAIIEFELKSTTKESVTTVRDFGMDHIEKWEGKHWLFGFYTPRGNALRFTRYASPSMMASWIAEKRKYMEADFKLASIVPKQITASHLFEIVGKKEVYSLAEAQSLHKKQLKAQEYRAYMDSTDGYTVERMVELLRLRCAYVIQRGSTLNNPHIPKGVLEGFPKITENHAFVLRSLVHSALNT